MAILHINNEPFHYQLSGQPDAPVLIFSNSLGTTLAMWDEQEAAFAKDFRVLRYDTRGHGLSVKSDGPYSIEQLGKDVLALADALDIDEFHFCGISMGGLTGQWLGVHAPDRVRGLAVCNTAAKLGEQQAWQDRANLVRSQGMEPVAATTAARWFTDDFVAKNRDKVDHWVNALRNTDPAGYAACCEALGAADLREDIGRIQAPTLVLTGTHDPVTTPADSDAIAARVPNATRVDLPTSHLSNLEDPAGFNDALHQHLLG